MKKNMYFTGLISLALLSGSVAFAKAPSQEVLERRVAQQIETAADHSGQVVSFMKNLAQKDPAKLANFLLENKYTYVYNESIIYVGVRENGEVLVVCQIDDSDTGDFYYVAHKKGNKVAEQSTATMPATLGFIALFERN